MIDHRGQVAAKSHLTFKTIIFQLKICRLILKSQRQQSPNFSQKLLRDMRY